MIQRPLGIRQAATSNCRQHHAPLVESLPRADGEEPTAGQLQPGSELSMPVLIEGIESQRMTAALTGKFPCLNNDMSKFTGSLVTTRPRG